MEMAYKELRKHLSNHQSPRSTTHLVPEGSTDMSLPFSPLSLYPVSRCSDHIWSSLPLPLQPGPAPCPWVRAQHPSPRSEDCLLMGWLLRALSSPSSPDQCFSHRALLLLWLKHPPSVFMSDLCLVKLSLSLGSQLQCRLLCGAESQASPGVCHIKSVFHVCLCCMDLCAFFSVIAPGCTAVLCGSTFELLEARTRMCSFVGLSELREAQ